jgi:hypothetical protein
VGRSNASNRPQALFIDGVSDFNFWVSSRHASEHQPPSTMSADSSFSTPRQTSTKADGEQNPASRNLRNDHMIMWDTDGDEIDRIC